MLDAGMTIPSMKVMAHMKSPAVGRLSWMTSV